MKGALPFRQHVGVKEAYSLEGIAGKLDINFTTKQKSSQYLLHQMKYLNENGKQ